MMNTPTPNNQRQRPMKRQRAAIGAAVAISVAICGTIAISSVHRHRRETTAAAVAVPSVRGAGHANDGNGNSNSSERIFSDGDGESHGESSLQLRRLGAWIPNLHMKSKTEMDGYDNEGTDTMEATRRRKTLSVAPPRPMTRTMPLPYDDPMPPPYDPNDNDVVHSDTDGGGHHQCEGLGKRKCKRNAHCEFSTSAQICLYKLSSITMDSVQCSEKSDEDCKEDPNCNLFGDLCIKVNAVGGGGMPWTGIQPILLDGEEEEEEEKECEEKNKKECRRDITCQYHLTTKDCTTRPVTIDNPHINPGDKSDVSDVDVNQPQVDPLDDVDVDVDFDVDVVQPQDQDDADADATANPIKYWPRRYDGTTKQNCVHSSDYPESFLRAYSMPVLFDTYEECCRIHQPCEAEDDVKSKEYKYWPMKFESGTHDCIYSNDYLDDFLHVMSIKVLFDTYDECCDIYPCRTNNASIELAAATSSSEPTVCSVVPAAAALTDTCSLDDDQFCWLDIGECNDKLDKHYGLCMPRGHVCEGRYIHPICGCDGVTYDHLCEAHAMGVSISKMGECSTDEGASGGVAGEGYDDGDNTPTITDEWPDGGNTPTSPTELMMTNTDPAAREHFLDHPTECAFGPGANTSIMCRPDEFCWLEMGECDSSSDVHYGLCMPVIEHVCEGDMDYPVCGCDDKTYSNVCEAFALGMSISRLDPCDTDAGLISTDSVNDVILSSNPDNAYEDPLVGSDGDLRICPKDLNHVCGETNEFCHLPEGTCDDPDVQFGLCVPKPVVCYEEQDPVCGCDGNTYRNLCLAHGMGVSISRMGECDDDAGTTLVSKATEIPPVPRDAETADDPANFLCTEDADCDNDKLCVARTGECICHYASNTGCSADLICDITPWRDCDQGCFPTCVCNFHSDATDGTNGCDVGEVCRQPCAIAGGDPKCFKSNEKRDCGKYGDDFMCRDGNGDGRIDKLDGDSGCVPERVQPHLDLAGGDGDGITHGDATFPVAIHTTATGVLAGENSEAKPGTGAESAYSTQCEWHVDVYTPHVCTNDGEIDLILTSIPDDERYLYFYPTAEACCSGNFDDKCIVIDECSSASSAGEKVEVDGLAIDTTNMGVLEGKNSEAEPGTGAESAYSTQCEWHVDVYTPHVCTNTGELDLIWTTIPDDERNLYFYPTAEACCQANFNTECIAIDDCSSAISAGEKVEVGGAAPSALCDWHISLSDQDTCTNSPYYPPAWDHNDLLHKYLFATGEECCAEFLPPGVCNLKEECHSKKMEAKVDHPSSSSSEYLPLDGYLVLKDMPWNYGNPPQWRMDDTVSAISGGSGYSVTNIPSTEPGASSNLSIKFSVLDQAQLSCLARIDINMPFDFFTIIVNGKYYREFRNVMGGGDSWFKLDIGFSAGENEVTFRVQNTDHDEVVDDLEDYGVYGTGRVWVDACEIIPYSF